MRKPFIPMLFIGLMQVVLIHASNQTDTNTTVNHALSESGFSKNTWILSIVLFVLIPLLGILSGGIAFIA